MTPRIRPSNLAARLVLLFAVLACLLGLGQAGAAAQIEPFAIAPTAGATATAHGDHPAAHVLQVDSAATVPTAPEAGHSGHGSDASHAMDCMTTTASSAIGALIIADTANLVTPAFVAPMSRLHTAVHSAAYPRPPDLRTLCVQRI
ncbi:MAG: hypothetical protein ACT4P1_16935 [Sporichthyaceae bacterium]